MPEPAPVILLTFANDLDSPLRQLAEEARLLRLALRDAGRAGRCQVEFRQNATLDDVLDALQDFHDQVAIFHYGGHAGSFGLLLQTPDGHTTRAHASGLTAFLAQQDGLRLVFLNGCSTGPQVQGLLDAGVPVVIATSQSIDDGVACQFAARFYRALASGAMLQEAYDQAEGAVQADRGDNPRDVYTAEGLDEGEVDTIRWPWEIAVRPGAEGVLGWRLPQLAAPVTGYIPPPRPDPDALPEPGDLPPGSRLPFVRNALFTGRVQPLLDLARALLHEATNAGAPAPVAQVIQGMGGIGKTGLAIEFAYRYGRFFHGVHWIAAAQPDLIAAEIAACGGRMGLEPWPQEQPEQVQRTVQAWHEAGLRLVILDNLEEVEAARHWLSRLQGGSVRLLLTARRQDWPRDLSLAPLRLDLFSPAESLAFLRRTLPAERAPDEELAALAERLGRLPLALELAARYLERLPRLTVPEYQGRLDDLYADPAMAGWRADLGNPTGHDLDLAATFRLSWEQVEDEDARRLFLIAGHCAPNQAILCELLEQAAVQPERTRGLRRWIGNLFRKRRPQLNLDEALSILTGLGLLEMDDPAAGPAIHPLLAEYARTLPGAGEALAALAGALASLTRQAGETGLPASFFPLRPHVEAAAPAAEAAGLEDAGALWNNLGYHLDMVADYAGARAAYERALAIDEAAYGPDHPNVAIRLSNLGDLLREMGDLPGARAALERALAIDEAAYGPDHPAVARDVNNLGLVLKDLGDLAGARAAFERALAIDEASYGPDHPNVAIRLNNLGMVLQDQGDLAGARAAFERALGIDEAAYGPDHPDVARDVNKLGSVLQDLGDLAGARAAFERALAIFEKQLGPDHPYVAATHNNLGSVLQDMGDLAGARAAYERALAIDEAVYGPDHPSVAIDINNLGSVLKALSDLDGARAAFERALDIFEARLGPDHPKTRNTRQWLASLDD